MTRVYVADAQHEERSALRLLLLDLNMEVVNEAADWLITLAPGTGLLRIWVPAAKPIVSSIRLPYARV